MCWSFSLPITNQQLFYFLQADGILLHPLRRVVHEERIRLEVPPQILQHSFPSAAGHFFVLHRIASVLQMSHVASVCVCRERHSWGSWRPTSWTWTPRWRSCQCSRRQKTRTTTCKCLRAQKVETDALLTSMGLILGNAFWAETTFC